ncbi:MAG: hypothetical protein HN846_01780 [Candidatus Pacebacteria bacterium]|jgi:hypothetical protein|nr:hypothetical protein [Candidatus Paceibacterota bacterium]MBT3511887.1 hypothetical protein [Candidatus Paceibacterota bacterium]MBT4005381.1 hypothetical protein [Candidatus Paceibacterota bacterium]MBT4359303.1 hypothetical protein [Candidatus Paceibacterota bacterium]MBT4681308.1 hypothetical protein [Candidatus Paceibacterota bacterium]
MAKIETPNDPKDLPVAVIKNMISLATSGFGLVVALAWNEVIKKTVTEYIDPWLGKSGSIISMLIYAVVITLLAVFVTMQLAQLQRKFEKLNEKLNGKPNTTSD